jgi:hypothetical protein
MAQYLVSHPESKAQNVVVDRMAIRAIMNYTKGVENDKRNI